MNLNDNHQIGFAYYPNSVFKVYTSVHLFTNGKFLSS